MCTVAAVEAIAPQFVGDPRVQPFIDDALILHDPTCWGNAFCQAIANFVAHNLVTYPVDGTVPVVPTGGAITNVSTGGMSVGYATPTLANGAEEDLASTVFGRKYLWIKSTRVCISPSFVTIL